MSKRARCGLDNVASLGQRSLLNVERNREEGADSEKAADFIASSVSITLSSAVS